MSRIVTVWALIFSLWGCDDGTPPDRDSATTADTGTTPLFGSGGAPLRPLTRTEYQHAIRDLLSIDALAEERFAPEPVVLGFDNNARAKTYGTRDVNALMRAAEDISAEWVASLSTNLSCAAAADEACGGAFVDDVAPRAYRRPLDDTERAVLMTIFRDTLAADDFETAIRLTLQVILQSPQFLYRLEEGDGPAAIEGFVTLSTHELAARLSFFLWSSTPDDALLALAADGSLTDPGTLETEARRLLADVRSADAIAYFHRSWLGLDALAEVSRADPTFTPALAAAMEEESLRFVASVLDEGTGTLAELIDADYTIANAELAMLYGAPPPSGEWGRVSLDPGERAGFLTHASRMTVDAHPAQTSIVHRGLFVLERMLCVRQPPPPSNVNITVPTPDPSLSTRERFARHRQDPACRGCHADMDNLGLGFEHYDNLGRFRITEGDGVPVDAHGYVRFAGQAPEAYYGARELADLLAASDDVRSCYVRQWFRFGFGREETDEDAATLQGLDATFADGDIRELLVTIVLSDAFVTRPVIDEGM